MQNISHREELKGRILDVAGQMFRSDGIRQVKMDDIAKALSISKRTLYETYENKEQLLLDVVKNEENKFSKDLEQNIDKDSNAIEILVEFYRLQMNNLSLVNPLFIEDMQAYDSVIIYLHKEHEERSNNKLLFVKKAIDEGYFLKNLNYDVIFSILEASSEDIMKANLYKKFGIATVFHNFVMIFIRGVCTEKGMVELDRLMQNI